MPRQIDPCHPLPLSILAHALYYRYACVHNNNLKLEIGHRIKRKKNLPFPLPTVPCIAHRSHPLKWRVLLSLYLPTQSGNNKSFVRRILRISIFVLFSEKNPKPNLLQAFFEIPNYTVVRGRNIPSYHKYCRRRSRAGIHSNNFFEYALSNGRSVSTSITSAIYQEYYQ